MSNWGDGYFWYEFEQNHSRQNYYRFRHSSIKPKGGAVFFTFESNERAYKKAADRFKIKKGSRYRSSYCICPEGSNVDCPKRRSQYLDIAAPWVDTNEMLFEAKKFGISFLPGSACYPKEPAMNHLRLCFAAVDDQLLETGIKTLCKIFTTFIEERNEESNMPLV